jgi:hypothetical protein
VGVGPVGEIVHEGDRSTRQYGLVGEIVNEGRMQYTPISTKHYVAWVVDLSAKLSMRATAHEGHRSTRQYGFVGEIVHEGRMQYKPISTQHNVAKVVGLSAKVSMRATGVFGWNSHLSSAGIATTASQRHPKGRKHPQTRPNKATTSQRRPKGCKHPQTRPNKVPERRGSKPKNLSMKLL